MDDKTSSIEVKLYIFSSADAKEIHYKWQIPLEENKDGILTGPLTYKSGTKNGRNPYRGKINPNESCKRLDQANQSFQEKPTKRVR